MFSYFPAGENRHILSVLPPKGISVYGSKVIDRDGPKGEITDTEMENAIAQAIWKMFDEERGMFASRLDISDMDVSLADVRVLNIRLDGNLVVNPVGFTAKKIEISLVETIVSRDLADEVKLAHPKKGETIFILEPSASCAWLIHKSVKQKDFLFANVAKDKTFIYRSEPEGRISYLSDFGWGTDHAASAFSANLSVSDSVGHDLLRRFARGNMSPEMAKSMRSAASKSLLDLVKGVSFATRNVKMKKPLVYVLSDDLAELEPKSISWGEGSPKFDFLPSVSGDEIARNEMEAADIDSAWNKIARRRMKWLTCGR